MRGFRVLKVANDPHFELVAGIKSPRSSHVIIIIVSWLSLYGFETYNENNAMFIWLLLSAISPIATSP